ncbi:ectonucleoside triphosphate diphosphohydrolase 1 isoform X2 [Entelurus aequoreus]|uniref:ectonucleoside triphosphate diphosphohydrolase 1 isoform X2 n=1 Tax=Entelurus aequoreus TaxID=161455 RepID=UPI002B1D2278|nr:ectonucleoside triphosphate diphosphohydrolase 1 isoform X2 [Entelurus aequoreus]
MLFSPNTKTSTSQSVHGHICLLPEMKDKNPWAMSLTVVIAVVGVIAVVALVTVTVVQNVPLLQKYKYGIVLDAGSSHTTVFIYQWPAEKDNNTGRAEQKHACNVKGPGISSYSGTPWKAGESLRACMQEVEENIPGKRHAETPLYLGATAGMRLLEKANSSASEEVFKAVSETLQKFPFSYQGARILSGQEEGAFGWVTVNYLDDRLKQGLETTGALDLGGASTQISFVSKMFDDSESPGNSVTFRLYGNDYNLYTHSFLCYGKDQALKMALAHQTQAGPQALLDPCMHPGYNKTEDYSSLYDSPCVSDRKPQGAPARFQHSGSGNFQQCQDVVRNLLDSSQCKHSQCSFNGVYQPTLEGMFGAFSAYYYAMSFLNLTDTSVPLQAVKERIGSFCATPWEQVQQQNPKIKLKYLFGYCFTGTYLITLLTEGYNFTSETYSSIKYVHKIKGSEAGWTLGYMLNLTNMIPAEAPDTPPLPYAGYVSIVTVIAVLLFVLLLLAVYSCRPRCSKPPPPPQVI